MVVLSHNHVDLRAVTWRLGERCVAGDARGKRRPSSLEVVTLDDRLAAAALKEGFVVLDEAAIR
jgi:hypothetical protein